MRFCLVPEGSQSEYMYVYVSCVCVCMRMCARMYVYPCVHVFEWLVCVSGSLNACVFQVVLIECWWIAEGQI